MVLHSCVMRVARPTDNLIKIAKMYERGLGLKRLEVFHDRAGTDGIVLGLPNLPYHLEFTHQDGTIVGKSKSEENLLVFYIPDSAEWQHACNCMEDAGFKDVPAYTPFWDFDGRTFEDLDGYRVVIHNSPPPH